MKSRVALAILGALALQSQTVHASNTDLSGTLFANIAPVTDTVTITSALTVPVGVTLTFNPGTVVLQSKDAPIIVKGALRSQGTSSDSIHYRSLVPGTTKYYDRCGVLAGIKFDNTDASSKTTDSSKISYSSFTCSQGTSGSATYQNHIIQVSSYNLLDVSYSNFSGNDSAEVMVVKNSSFRVHHNRFAHNNAYNPAMVTRTGMAIQWDGGTPVIERNHFEDNSATQGGAIYLNNVSNAQILANLFEDNYGTGGSIYGASGTYEITRNRFDNNGTQKTNSQGIALYLAGQKAVLEYDTIQYYHNTLVESAPVTLLTDSSIIAYSVLRHNFTRFHTGFNYEGGVVRINANQLAIIDHSLFYRDTLDAISGYNKYGLGVGAYVTGTGNAYVIHSTFSKNVGLKDGSTTMPLVHGGGFYLNQGACINSISFDNQVYAGYLTTFGNQASAPASYGCVYTKDPGFEQPSMDNFRLLSISQVLDAGILEFPYVKPFDLAGNTRKVHQSPDPGAFEYQTERYADYLMGVFNHDTTITGIHQVRNDIIIPAGVTMTLAPGCSLAVWPSAKLIVHGRLVAQGDINSPVIFDNFSKNTGYWNGIQTVKTLHSPWANDGVKGLDLKHVVIRDPYANGLNFTFDNHTLRHVKANGNFVLGSTAGLSIDSSSIGYTNLSTLLQVGATNNVQLTNTVVDSGAVSFTGRSRVWENLTFLAGVVVTFNGAHSILRNSRFHNARLILSDSAVVWNTLFKGSASTSKAAIKMTTGSKMINSTVINGAWYGVQADKSSSIDNSLLWNNYNSGVPQITAMDAEPPLVTRTCLQNGYVGTGNVSVDPLFADTANGNYGLLAGSPCLDIGDTVNLQRYMTLTDLNGNSRIRNYTIDAGAVELQVGNTITFEELPVAMDVQPFPTLHSGSLRWQLERGVLSIESSVAKAVQVQWRDLRGRVLWTRNISLQKGMNQVSVPSVQGNQAGLLMIQ